MIMMTMTMILKIDTAGLFSRQSRSGADHPETPDGGELTEMKGPHGTERPI